MLHDTATADSLPTPEWVYRLGRPNDFLREKVRARSKWHRSVSGFGLSDLQRIDLCFGLFRNRTYIAVQSAPRRGRHTLRRARCAAACRSRNRPITVRCVSSSALWQYVGSLAESQYRSHIFAWQVIPHTKVGFSLLLTCFFAHTAGRRRLQLLTRCRGFEDMRSKARGSP